jgi:Uma2 family endonuclease
MQLPSHRHFASVAEYLRHEQDALYKHEYRDGEIIAMAGNSYNHSLIAANVIGELRNPLKGKTCRVVDSNLRIGIPRTPLYTYPDASVIGGPVQMDPNDSSGQTATNPRLIVEILSPSTEAYDRGEKFKHYRQIESLQEYVLISQDVARVESFFRQPDGTWLFTSVSGAQSVSRLASLGLELSLAEVYAGVEFPPEPSVPTNEVK